MPTEYSPSGSRRSSRRGGRRPGRQNGGNSSYRQESSNPAPAKKKSLWESIVSFFAGNPPPKTKSTASNRGESNGSSTSRKSEKPLRTQQPPRKPEFVEVSSPRLYVGNLSFDATESDLLDLFNGVGLVQNVEVVSNRHTMKSKGFAFVQMQTTEEAKRAVTELHDKEYMGRKLVVSGAKALEEKRSDRNRQPEQ